MARPQKTVFISYRRSDISWALAVYHYLTSHNFDVFFDYKSIPSGDFEQIIAGNIKARAHFLLILTPSALERCADPGDWLRREIETALREKRNIIPLFFEDFSFAAPAVAEQLTGALENLRRYNGLEVPSGYFDEAMQRLQDRYLNVTLEAVLHPVSEEVQKAVKEHQVAADRAIARRPAATGIRASEDQPRKALPPLTALVQQVRRHAWLYARLLALALMLTGVLGPWVEIRGCSVNSSAPPPPQTWPGYHVFYILVALLNPVMTPPALLFALLAILLILILLSKRIRQSRATRWIERACALLTPVSYGVLLFMARESIVSLLWGFYLSMCGVALAAANTLSEWSRERRKAKGKSAPTTV